MRPLLPRTSCTAVRAQREALAPTDEARRHAGGGGALPFGTRALVWSRTTRRARRVRGGVDCADPCTCASAGERGNAGGRAVCVHVWRERRASPVGVGGYRRRRKASARFSPRERRRRLLVARRSRRRR